MKRNFANVCLVITGLLAVGLGCDGHSRVSGRVYDSTEKPVVGARVIFEQLSEGRAEKEYYKDVVETDVDGRFLAAFTHAPFGNIPMRLSVQKEGFKIYRVDFTSDDARGRMEKGDDFKIILIASD